MTGYAIHSVNRIITIIIFLILIQKKKNNKIISYVQKNTKYIKKKNQCSVE